MLEFTLSTLRDGREHSVDFDAFTLGLQVRAEDGHETYLAVRITGSVPTNLAILILRNVPGCELDGWYPEYALPERDLLPAEQARSNLMDPAKPPVSWTRRHGRTPGEARLGRHAMINDYGVATAKPDGAWLTQLARNFLTGLVSSVGRGPRAVPGGGG
jgi:hypothetical protein